MIDIFHDTQGTFDHEKFQLWRRRNNGGFFVNVKSPANLMLHRTNCPHLGDFEWEREKGWGSLSRSRKICSVNIAELQQHIAENHGTVQIKKCADCKPD